jgi:hypothetical protein
VPLAPRVARAIDLAIGERAEGPIFIEADCRRVDRHAAGRICAHHPPGRDHQAGRTAHLRHAFITAALDARVPLRDVQEAASHADPRTTMRHDRGRQSLDRHATHIVRHLHRQRLTLTDPVVRRSVPPATPDATPGTPVTARTASGRTAPRSDNHPANEPSGQYVPRVSAAAAETPSLASMAPGSDGSRDRVRPASQPDSAAQRSVAVPWAS